MTKLERSLGLLETTLIGVGIILGAGIYVIIGEAAGLSGNSLWISFIIAAVVATLTGLSYAELSSRFPHAGAEYIYVKNSFGSLPAWLVSWLIIIGTGIMVATISIGFANYFSALISSPPLLVSLGMLIICGVILIVGVKETASFTILFTLIEATGLAIIIFIGLPHFGSVDYFAAAQGMKGIIQAGVLIFFGYLGFESIARLSEETKDARKTIPKAIILSIVITTIIYLLVGIAAVSAVSWQDLAQADAPLSFVARQAFGQQSFILLTAIALFSTFNTALASLLSGSRVVYGIAKEKVIPPIFSSVLQKTRTPWIAIIGMVLLSILFLSVGDLKTVANLTNFTIFVIFILVNASVILLRYKKPSHQGFKIPLSIGKLPLIPVFGIITSVLMIINLSLKVLLLGALVVIVGLVVYYFFVREQHL